MTAGLRISDAAAPDRGLEVALRPLGDPAALEADWRRLEAESDSSFFTAWPWIGTALELMEPAPLVLRVTEGERAVALALLWPDRRGRTLRLNLGPDARFAVVYPEYNGLLAVRGREGEALAAVLAALPRLGAFDALRVDGAAPETARRAEASGWLVSLRDWKRRYEVDLAAARARGAYLDGLSRNARQQLRRSLRAAERAGGASLQAASSLTQALEWFGDLERLHTHYWRGRGEGGAFAEPFFRKFNQRLIMSAFDSGHVEIVRAQIGDLTVGYLYNFIYRKRVLYYQSGFDYKLFPKIRCGLLTHCLNIERHMRAGAVAYDFMAGEQRYKAALGREAGELLWFVLLRPTWQNRLTERLRRAKAWLDGARARESASSFVV